MNYEFAAIITLFGSFIGMGVILIRKIPALKELSNSHPSATLAPPLINWYKWLGEKIRIPRYFTMPAAEIFLQRILSKIRILTLKLENKTGSWLQKLREKSQKKKFKENDNYWKEIKKSTRK